MTSPKVLLLLTAFAAQAQVSVTTYRNNLARSGANLAETILTPANVNPAGFGRLFSLPVDGQVYAQPLYVPLVNIPGKGIHNVVFVATEHDSVYAFDADSAIGPNAAPLWRVNFTNPLSGERTVNVTDVLGCLSIEPELGITGTPVIDPSTGTLYVVASTILNGEFFHRLHALDIATGAERPGSPALIQAVVPGTGDGFSQTTVPFHPYLYKNRAGLLLLHGAVYTAWTSHCDAGSFHGWLIGYDGASLQQTAIFNDSPNAFQGALWMGGAAPAADAEGNIYVVSGNGPFDDNSNGAGLGDSFIKLSSAGGLRVADYFTPFNQVTLNREDIDLGSSGPLLLPDDAGNAAHPHLAVGAGKEGRIYLLDRDRMGRFSAANDNQIVQSVAGALGPVYGGAAYLNHTLFFAGANDSLKAFPISGAHLTPSPSSQSPQVFGDPGAAPAVSSNGARDGTVWVVEPGFGGTLHAYDAANLSHELYNSQIDAARDSLGSFVKFSVPLIANGRVYVGTGRSLAVYGLLHQPPQPQLYALVNAASLQLGPVAPGSLISIFGSGLAPTMGADGLTLSINGIACPLLFASPNQINAQAPFELTPGPATAVLQPPQMPPAAIPLMIAPVAPGIFLVRNTDGSINGAANPAKAGSVVSVVLTGQGLSLLANESVVATVRGRPEEILSAAVSPGSIGLFEISVRVPAVKTGASQLVIKINGASSNAAALYVAASPPSSGGRAKRK
jgi:uncharacterized protein (TIGR03437 family)